MLARSSRISQVARGLMRWSVMNYAVHVKHVPPQVVVSQRRHTSLAELGGAMHETIAEIVASVDPPDAMRGAPFAVYYNEPFKPEDVEVEMGVPVAPDTKVLPRARVERRELIGGPVAYTIHVGPYETIGKAYEALFAWIEKHGHHRIGPPRETYLVGPGKGISPSMYRTEIEVPID